MSCLCQGAAQHEHRPAKVGEFGAVPGADEAETEHWWLQLQRGGKVAHPLHGDTIALKVFQRIDDDFRLIMGDAVKDPRVIAILRWCYLT